MNHAETVYLWRDIRAVAKIYRTWDKRMRTCACGRVCMRGDTFVRHRERCTIGETPDLEQKLNEETDALSEEFLTRYQAIIDRLGNPHEPIPISQGDLVIVNTALADLELDADRFHNTLGALSEESEVLTSMKSFEAQLLRLQYEVPPERR